MSVGSIAQRVATPARDVSHHERRTVARSAWLLHLWLLAVAAALWIVSVRAVRLDDMAGLGLLDALPATYFEAIAVVTLGFVFATAHERLHPALLWMYVLALIWLLHGTTPLLYDEPRYGWTYKHLGAINLIAATGGADRGVDIYMNWPGFFVLNAWLKSVTGVEPIRYAEWSQVFFAVANMLALRFALRGLTSDSRLIWRATWLFVLGNWVGQEYLSPQALGFLLSLVVLGVCLRGAPSGSATRLERRWRRQLDAVGARLGAGTVDSCPPEAVLPSRERLVVGGLCYLAVVVSHQLSPVMAIGGATTIWLLTRRVPVWVPLAMLVIELWWVALSWSYIEGRFGLSFNPFALPGGHYPRSQALAGFVWVSRASFTLSAALSVLAVVGLARRLRARHWDLAAAGLVAAATAVVLGQDYGGEIMLRVYLFGLPWLAFFAAAALGPTRQTRRFSLGAHWRLIAATAALSALLLVAYFGSELQNRFEPDDVAIAAWYEQHAPPRSLLLFVTPNVPNRLTERYPRLLIPSEDYNPNLTDNPGFRANGIGPEDIPAIERTIRDDGAPHSFIVFTPSEERSARLYGLLRGGSLAPFERALSAGGRFRLVKSIGAARLYEYRRHPRRP
jgi:hypothetical protein